MTNEYIQDGSYEQRKASQKTVKTAFSSYSSADFSKKSEASKQAGVPMQVLAIRVPALHQPLMHVTVPSPKLSMNNLNGARTAMQSAVKMKQDDDIGAESSAWKAWIASKGSSGWNARQAVPEFQTESTVLSKDGKSLPALRSKKFSRWRQFIQSRFTKPPSLVNNSDVARVPIPVYSIKVRRGTAIGSSLEFFPLDDVVKGGASASIFDNDSRKWTGQVTSRNSGGFVGIRANMRRPFDLTGTEGLELKLRLKGNERGFKFVLRDSTDVNGIKWTTSIGLASPEARRAQTIDLVARTVSRVIQPWLYFFLPPAFDEEYDVETVRISYSSLIPFTSAKPAKGVSIDLTNIVAMELTHSRFEYDRGDFQGNILSKRKLNPRFTEGSFEMDVVDVATY